MYSACQVRKKTVDNLGPTASGMNLKSEELYGMSEHHAQVYFFSNANCFRSTFWGCLWPKIAENTFG